MVARVEITAKYARAYARASKKERGRKHAYDATKVLQRVWAFQCGKYLAATMNCSGFGF